MNYSPIYNFALGKIISKLYNIDKRYREEILMANKKYEECFLTEISVIIHRFVKLGELSTLMPKFLVSTEASN